MLAECCFLPRVRKRLRLFCFPEESVRVPGLDAELCAMIGLRGVGALSSMTQALRVDENLRGLGGGAIARGLRMCVL